MNQQLLDSARSNVRMIESMAAGMQGNAQIAQTLADARQNVAAIEAQMGIGQVPVGQAPAAPSIEQRVANLENLVQKVAAPAIDEAAKAGMALMSALGNGMTPEQAQWVQHRLNNSPEFFASQGCKDALDIFVQEWMQFEGGKK